MFFAFVDIPKVGPIPFQIIEENLVQRCETRIDADACKASYFLGDPGKAMGCSTNTA